ncbi:hypothetical protein T12_3058 [Trichinella patagoniensis]|uniref:Uncharacterized protein n=1 Tax=Trichinella patagoniensis TaxID=990121 RepID=A0A0V1ADQ1_9BILA|nr:hypothetical protein T12_3058 [Trichinella patagoniensis]
MCLFIKFYYFPPNEKKHLHLKYIAYCLVLFVKKNSAWEVEKFNPFTIFFSLFTVRFWSAFSVLRRTQCLLGTTSNVLSYKYSHCITEFSMGRVLNILLSIGVTVRVWLCTIIAINIH